jgi:hypothetical protein
MSEYQYYEFQAIDRPLTDKEVDELRSYSSRARISPTSFVNEYAWGSFKGNEDAWMEKYFDAFIYIANWGTHALKLRLPSRLLDLKCAEQYCVGESSSVREKDGKVIVSFVSHEEGGGEWVEGEGQLSSLVPLRAELARGDVRVLYLGWLLCAQNGDLDDDAVEPPVPPGLGQLSASLVSLTEFLCIDEDLLLVAARVSPALDDRRPSHDEVRAWVAKLSAGEKEDFIARLIAEEDSILATELLRRFFKERDEAGGRPAAPAHRRTVGELLCAAEAHGEEQRRIEAEKRTEEQARREREAAIARETYLDGIAGHEPKLWAEVDTLVATKQPKRYDEAVKLVLDLRNLHTRTKSGDFRLRIEALRQAHAHKPSFLERLRKAGL